MREPHDRCGEAMSRLWDYIDGELTPESAAAVRMHLDACARCFPELDFHRGFCEFLRRTCEEPCCARRPRPAPATASGSREGQSTEYRVQSAKCARAKCARARCVGARLAARGRGGYRGGA